MSSSSSPPKLPAPGGAGASPALDAAAASVAASVGGLITGGLRDVSSRLGELHDSQRLLAGTVAAKTRELGASPEWAAAAAVLDRVPEYRAKVDKIRRGMAAVAARAERVERGAAALAARLEERDRERASRKTADVAGYASVASR